MIANSCEVMRIFTKHPARLIIPLISTLILAFGLITDVQAQQGQDSEIIQQGAQIFAENCAVCHGPKGKGDGYQLFDPPPSDLTSVEFQNKSYDDLWHSIHDGVPDTAMGMWKTALTDEEITTILSYVRSLAQ